MFIDDGLFVELAESLRLPDGRLYSIVLIGPGAHGRVEVRVAPGSRFEVVTPSAIAGVRGTRFAVTTDAAAGRERTAIEVLSGEQDQRSWLCSPVCPARVSLLGCGLSPR